MEVDVGTRIRGEGNRVVVAVELSRSSFQCFSLPNRQDESAFGATLCIDVTCGPDLCWRWAVKRAW